MSEALSSKIVKSVNLSAPPERVWKALSDSREFGEWFRVHLDAPFAVGQPARGHILNPGYEHIQWEAIVQKMDSQKTFSFTWHPYAVKADIDYSKETPSLVEFRIERVPDGTRLTLVESGFDKLPEERRAEAYRMHEMGWAHQADNIARHLQLYPERF